MKRPAVSLDAWHTPEGVGKEWRGPAQPGRGLRWLAGELAYHIGEIERDGSLCSPLLRNLRPVKSLRGSRNVCNACRTTLASGDMLDMRWQLNRQMSRDLEEAGRRDLEKAEPLAALLPEEKPPLPLYLLQLVNPTNARGDAPLGLRTSPRRETMPRTDIYQEDEDISIVTTAIDERDFLESFTEALGPIMANGMDPHHQRSVISAGFDIVAKLRGYKSDVQERRVLAAGRWPHPSEVALSSAGADDVDEAPAEE